MTQPSLPEVLDHDYIVHLCLILCFMGKLYHYFHLLIYRQSDEKKTLRQLKAKLKNIKFRGEVKGQAQAKIVKKSVILFWLLIMTI